MNQSSDRYQRRNTLRHPKHDYTQPGAYFVTVCAHRGRSIFGQVVDGEMRPNQLGDMAAEIWTEFASEHPTFESVAFMIMPNHAHFLILLQTEPDISQKSTENKPRQFGDATAGSLSTIIGTYKSMVTQKAKNAGLIPGPPLWQRNFYDHIVRNDEAFTNIKEYIRTNPAKWHDDQLHPNAPPNQFNRTWKNP